MRLKGLRILAKQVKTPRGEIDLIARRSRVLAFVEVNWWVSATELDFAVDDYRLRRVRAAAEAVGHRYAGEGDEQRIDVILLAPGRFPRHMANALMP